LSSGKLRWQCESTNIDVMGEFGSEKWVIRGVWWA
jgi:hypothetical protein